MSATCKDCAYWIDTTANTAGACKLLNGPAQLVGVCWWYKNLSGSRCATVGMTAERDVAANRWVTQEEGSK